MTNGRKNALEVTKANFAVKDWKQLKVTYVPTFLEGKSLTFVMNASDVIRS